MALPASLATFFQGGFVSVWPLKTLSHRGRGLKSFFSVYPAERCVLNGKVTVVLKGVSVVVMNCHFGVVIDNVST